MNFNIILKHYLGHPTPHAVITSNETGDMSLGEVCVLLNDQADKINELQTYIDTLERQLTERPAGREL